MSWKILASDEGIFGIDAAIEKVRAGCDALDVIEHGIRAVESDKRALTVSYGGAPNILGKMELDASIMVGENRMVAAVGAIQRTIHPISVARRLLGKMPHIFLTGAGAKRFAEEEGLGNSNILSKEAKSKYSRWIKDNIKEDLAKASLSKYISFKTRSDLSRGTVTFIVRSPEGKFIGGVSTSGWAYKYPGRIGDSPIIGAGLYVDDRYGAVTCTHTGEMTIRCSTAHSVIHEIKRGASVKEACLEAANDLKTLNGGYLGPVVIHAMDRRGECCVLGVNTMENESYVYWDSGEDQYRVQECVVF